MSPAEINGDDVRGVPGQVRQDIATAGGDRHDATLRTECQRFEIDLGTLPDLGVDETAKEAFEQSFQNPFEGKRTVAPHGFFQTDAAFSPQIGHSHSPRIDSIRDV